MKKHLSIKDNPLFPELNVLVIVGGDEEYWQGLFSEAGDTFHECAIRGETRLFLPDDHDGYCKFTQLHKSGWTGDVPCILMHFPEVTFDHAYAPDVFSSSIILHECLHAAQYIMEHYGISYTEKEFFARIQQWLYKAIAEWVEEEFFQEEAGLSASDTLARLGKILETTQRAVSIQSIATSIEEIIKDMKGDKDE